MSKKLIFKKGCIYVLDANKIQNHLKKTLSKQRPFICINIKTINKIEYLYFISGTSKNKNERKQKQFSKYFFIIKKGDVSNTLEKNTFFQSASIFIIPKDSMANFIKNKRKYFLGELKKSEKDLFNKHFEKVNDDKIISFIYNEDGNSNYLIHYQRNFLFIATRHNKLSGELKKRIIKNKKEADNFMANNKKFNVKEIFSSYKDFFL